MVGGPFISHTLAGRRFACDADDTATIQVQGRDNEAKPNGDGTVRFIQSRVTGTLEGTNLIFDPKNGDDDFLLELKETGVPFDYSGTANDQTVWAGNVQITGELKFDYKEGKVPVTLSGTFQKQG
jgi:hypothetical protein